jgi:hypothetical protein
VASWNSSTSSILTEINCKNCKISTTLQINLFSKTKHSSHVQSKGKYLTNNTNPIRSFLQLQNFTTSEPNLTNIAKKTLCGSIILGKGHSLPNDCS